MERNELKKIHKQTNPEIHYNLFEWNYGWLQVESGNDFEITVNGNKVLEFMRGKSYNDKRKPNEIQTTDQ